MATDKGIDILITKFFSGEALPEEAMELEDWANMSPGNKSYFNNYSKILAMPIEITYDERNRAWKNINDIIYKQESKPKSKVINWRLAGIAASIMLSLTIGLVIINYIQKENDTIVYKTGAASKTILLKDKSEIIVLPNSAIKIDKEYGLTNRKIKLNGSATFSVVHNPSLEFIIDVNNIHIKDIGTRFNVVSSPTSDTIFINVDDGEILVYDDFGSSENASSGENVLYIRSNKKLRGFHIKHEPSITTTKQDERPAEVKKQDLSIIKQSIPSTADSSGKGNPYPSYPSQYPLDQGYTPEGKQALIYKDSVETNEITTDMLRDKLITSEQSLSFRLSNTEFIINGKPQSNDIFQRYRKKYIPASSEGKEWVWSHNSETQGANHK